MSEFDPTPEERLSALDPMAQASYAPVDLNATLRRVTAVPLVTKVGLARGLRLRIGSAASAAALATVGGIFALSGAATSLPVLSLGASHSLGAATNDKASPSSTFMPAMRIWGHWVFVAGPDLSTASGSAPTYILSAPSDLTGSSQSIAAVFHVTGDPSQDPATNGYWSIGDNQQLSFWTGNGVLSWSFSSANGATAVSSDPGTTVPTDTAPVVDQNVPDNATLDSWAQSYLDALGLTGQVSNTQYSSHTDPTTGVVQATVSYDWTPNGVDTQQNISFTFDGTGALQWANGVSGSLSDGGSYPTLSEAAGVAALQSQQDSFQGGPIVDPVPGTVVPDTTNSGSSTGSAPSSSGSTDTTGSTDVTTTTEPIHTVTLDTATIQYSTYTLTDGTVMLLPQYSYTGDDGSTWNVLALDPAYVSVQQNTIHPMMY